MSQAANQSKGKIFSPITPIFHSKPEKSIALWKDSLFYRWSWSCLRLDEYVPKRSRSSEQFRQYRPPEGQTEQSIWDYSRVVGEPKHSQEGDADPPRREGDPRECAHHEAERHAQGSHERASQSWGGDPKALCKLKGRDFKAPNTGYLA